MDAAEPHRERSTNHPLTPVFPAAMPGILRETTQRHPQASALDDGQGALSYRELMACAIAAAVRLQLAGVHRGDRVGVRMASGSRELYISILAVLAAGGAYVPVDADDPEERAELVFRKAGVRGVITGSGRFTPSGDATDRDLSRDCADRPLHTRCAELRRGAGGSCLSARFWVAGGDRLRAARPDDGTVSGSLRPVSFRRLHRRRDA